MFGRNRLCAGIDSERQLLSVSSSAFRIHGPMKALFYKLLGLVNPAPREWLDQLTGNNAVIRDIYMEYLQHDKEAGRVRILERVIPFALCLTDEEQGDTAYNEVFQYFLYRICQEYRAGRFQFNPMHINPHCWYQDGRGRELSTVEENLRAIQEMRSNRESNPGKISRDISETEQGLRSD